MTGCLRDKTSSPDSVTSELGSTAKALRHEKCWGGLYHSEAVPLKRSQQCAYTKILTEIKKVGAKEF